MKLYKKGLVIGKFYPLHEGHIYTINSALKRVSSLDIIVCQTDKYKIPVSIRAGWIKEIFPQVNIHTLNHDSSLDSTSTKLSARWAKVTIDFLGYSPEVVFSSEKYGITYAKCMKADHFPVDYKRKTVPISGTRIRKNIAANWSFLPEPVRAYFAQRVVILGAESTGKTTLAKNLADYYETNWVPEYGRLYYEGKVYAKGQPSWKSWEFKHIAIKQKEIENDLVRSCNYYLVCDTDPLATSVWHKRYLGFWSKELESLINPQDYCLYILTAPDIPFKQDSTRDSEHLRKWMHQLFLKELKKRKLKYLIVTGNRQKRLIKAVQELKNLPTIKL